MLGNVEPALHAHIFPRFKNEPKQLRLKPVWSYDWDNAPKFDLVRDAEIMQAIADSLEKRGLRIE
jgi:diadenosine tetraphosphate (Ap4A) HIT family hydrolase